MSSFSQYMRNQIEMRREMAEEDAAEIARRAAKAKEAAMSFAERARAAKAQMASQ